MLQPQSKNLALCFAPLGHRSQLAALSRRASHHFSCFNCACALLESKTANLGCCQATQNSNHSHAWPDMPLTLTNKDDSHNGSLATRHSPASLASTESGLLRTPWLQRTRCLSGGSRSSQREPPTAPRVCHAGYPPGPLDCRP